MNDEFISVEDSLPVNSSNDANFDGSYYEVDVVCIVDGREEACVFYACWEMTIDDDKPPVFLTEFDCSGDPTHWKFA